MNTKKQFRKNKSYNILPPVEGKLTGTALARVTIFLQEKYAMTSTGTTFTIDSNDETTQQILEKHINKFSEAWETLADK